MLKKENKPVFGLILVIAFILLIIFFLRLNYTGFTILNQFNDTLTTESLSFTDGVTENIIKYIYLSKYVNVSYAYMNLSVFEYYGNQTDGFDISSAGLSIPEGITTNGSDFWIVDNTDDFVYHFNRTGVNQTDGFYIGNHDNSDPKDITTNGSDFWIVDGADNFVYHFNRTGANQTDGFYIGNLGAEGITTNNSDFWVVDYTNNFVSHFNRTGANQTDGFYMGDSNDCSIGITSNNSDFWITDCNDDFFVSHFNSIGVNQSDGFDFGAITNGGYATGITTNVTLTGGKPRDFWIVDKGKDSVYHISLVFPVNTSLDIGNNSIQEWNHTGTFTLTNNKTTDFASSINSYLSSCSPDSYGNCSIPLIFHSDTSGKIEAFNLNIQYNSSPIVTNVQLFPALPEVENSLTCTDDSASDPESDSYNLAYDFFGANGNYTLLYLPFDKYATDVSQYRNTYLVYPPGSFYRNGTYVTNGKVGGGWKFNGLDEFFQFTSGVTKTNYTKMTMEVWVNLTSNLPGAEVLNDGLTLRGVTLMTNDGNNNLNFRLRITPPGGAYRIEKNLTYSNAGLTLGNWHHLAGVWNGEEGYARLYLDGALVASTTDTLSNITNPPADFYIGINDLSTVYLNGTIDEVRVYNASLSTAQILAHYNLNYSELDSSETDLNENWFCSITPIDINGIMGRTLNSSVSTFRDSINPTLILNPSVDTGISLGGSITLTCTGADNVGLQSTRITVDGSSFCSGVLTCTGSYQMATSTSRTVNCIVTDTYGNTASKSITLSTSGGGGGAGGGGGGSSSEPTVQPVVQPPVVQPPETIPLVTQPPIIETPTNVIPLIVPQTEITSWVSNEKATIAVSDLAQIVYSYIDVGGIKKPKVDISFSQKNLREIKSPISINYIDWLSYCIISLSILILVLLIVRIVKNKNYH